MYSNQFEWQYTIFITMVIISKAARQMPLLKSEEKAIGNEIVDKSLFTQFLRKRWAWEIA